MSTGTEELEPAAVRRARPDDVPAIAAIYGHAVRTSIATFDLEVPGEQVWAARVDVSGDGEHVLVVELDGEVAGYAYSSRFRPRPGYAGTRESSIYLAPHAVGRRWGTALYRALLDLLREDGIHVVTAVVALPNDASVALHERLGFRHVGTLHEVGRKFDRWIDTAWYELRLEP